MSNYYTMACSKGAACKCKKKHGKGRKRRRDSDKMSRPFAPEYSTSTISKAIDLVYGMPEFPKNPRAWDVPGTTHLNIFHRSGVSNGNDVLGQVTTDEYTIHTNEHSAYSSGASSRSGMDPDVFFEAMRARQDTEPMNVNVVRDEQPVTAVDLDQPSPESATPRSHKEQLFGRRDDESSDDSSEEYISSNNSEDLNQQVGSREFWETYNMEPIGDDGNIKKAIDDIIANVERLDNTVNTNRRGFRERLVFANGFTPRPQGEMPAGTSRMMDAYNEALGTPLPENPDSLFRQAVNTALPTTDADELMELARNTPLPVDEVRQVTDRKSQVKAAIKGIKLKKINGKQTASSDMRRYNIRSYKTKSTKFSGPNKKGKEKR